MRITAASRRRGEHVSHETLANSQQLFRNDRTWRPPVTPIKYRPPPASRVLLGVVIRTIFFQPGTYLKVKTNWVQITYSWVYALRDLTPNCINRSTNRAILKKIRKMKWVNLLNWIWQLPKKFTQLLTQSNPLIHILIYKKMLYIMYII